MRFVICEDTEKFMSDITMITNKVMAPYDYDYKISKFNSLTKELIDIIEDNSYQKIYILDIQLKDSSGLEIASKIREKDWKSIIIFVTAYKEYRDDIFYSRLLALDYISKHQFFKERLTETLNKVLTIINQENVLVFKYNYVTYRVKYDDIVYIEKIPSNRKCIIVTENGNQFEIIATIQELLTKLGNKFYQSHQSCIVNTTKIRKIDCSNNIIIFNNNEKIYLLSNKQKKGLKNYVAAN